MVLTLIFAVALSIVATIFALQNPTVVTANFFGYQVDGSLALFVLLGLGVGLLIGVLVMTPGRIKSGLANSRHRRKIVELEANLEARKSAVESRQAQEPIAPASQPVAPVPPAEKSDTDPLNHS
ncbi:MAG: lipopolysaccharide assembly protein LapA domain-containing protein [Chloroflexota bacterium]